MADLPETAPCRVIDLVSFFELMESAEFADFTDVSTSWQLQDFFRRVSCVAENCGLKSKTALVTFFHDTILFAASYEVTAPNEMDEATLRHIDWKNSEEPDFLEWRAQYADVFMLDVDTSLSVILG